MREKHEPLVRGRGHAGGYAAGGRTDGREQRVDAPKLVRWGVYRSCRCFACASTRPSLSESERRRRPPTKPYVALTHARQLVYASTSTAACACGDAVDSSTTCKACYARPRKSWRRHGHARSSWVRRRAGKAQLIAHTLAVQPLTSVPAHPHLNARPPPPPESELQRSQQTLAASKQQLASAKQQRLPPRPPPSLRRTSQGTQTKEDVRDGATTAARVRQLERAVELAMARVEATNSALERQVGFASGGLRELRVMHPRCTGFTTPLCACGWLLYRVLS